MTTRTMTPAALAAIESRYQMIRANLSAPGTSCAPKMPRKFTTCGAQGTGWHETDRCGSSATIVMFWAGRACSLCEGCAAELVGNDANFAALPVAVRS